MYKSFYSSAKYICVNYILQLPFDDCEYDYELSGTVPAISLAGTHSDYAQLVKFILYFCKNMGYIGE